MLDHRRRRQLPRRGGHAGPATFGNVVGRRRRRSRTQERRVHVAERPGRSTRAHTWGVQAKRVRTGAIVEIIDPPPAPPAPPGERRASLANTLATVSIDARRHSRRSARGGGNVALGAPTTIIQIVELQVTVHVDDARSASTCTTSSPPTRPAALHRQGPRRRTIPRTRTPSSGSTGDSCGHVATRMRRRPAARAAAPTAGYGSPAATTALCVSDPDDRAAQRPIRDHAAVKATGLAALGEIDDIAIVALPDGGDATTTPTQLPRGAQALDRPRREAAATGSPSSTGRQSSSITEIRDVPRQVRLEVRRALPPVDRDPRSDCSGLRRARRRGGCCCRRRASSPASTRAATSSAACYKAPANEVVRGLTRFEININKGRQDVLNPEGINALRFFEGRGNRVWGARTMSSDPGVEVRQRAAALHLPRALDRQGHAVGGVRAEQRARSGRNIRQHDRGLPAASQWRDGALLGDEAGGGVLRPLRPHDDDPERPRQRPADLPDRRRADQAGRVRDLPHRPVDRRRAS